MPAVFQTYQTNNLEQTLKDIERDQLSLYHASQPTGARPIRKKRLNFLFWNLIQTLHLCLKCLLMPLISGNQPEFGLLLKNKFFLMFPEVGLSDVAIKVNCGYKCSDELNTMLMIPIFVPPISFWSLLYLASTIPGVLEGWMGEWHMGTFLPMVDTWHWLPEFPDLTSMLCRLGVDETSGMQKVRYWN